MAVSNAIGANVFSILVGLGLPWFGYPIFINKPYDGITDGGILPLLTILLGLALGYYMIIRLFNYSLHFWYYA